MRLFVGKDLNRMPYFAGIDEICRLRLLWQSLHARQLRLGFRKQARTCKAACGADQQGRQNRCGNSATIGSQLADPR
ncbi:hypothetical protein D3C80_2021540 [compost metagenome]